jgi:type II secretion system protein G
MKSQKNKPSGFTLIELLVVISIIGLLASVVLVSLNTARTKARDAKRIADLSQIRTALELYFDANGFYPASACGWDCNGYSFSSNPGQWNTLQTTLSPYINPLPVDPTNTGGSPWGAGGRSYSYGNVGRTIQKPQYDLTTQLETPHEQRCEVRNWKFYFDDRSWCTAWGGNYSNQVYEASD